MRGTGDRPLRCEPTTNRKKTGKRSAPSRVDARLLLWPSLLLSPRCSSFFDLTRLPIRNWKISPTKKRRETTTREGFSKESAARSMMRVWNVVVRSRFCPVVVFWFVVRRALVFGVEKTRRLGRKISLFCPFFCGFFFLQKETKRRFSYQSHAFFFRPTSNRAPHPTPGGDTPPNTKNAAARERNDDASTTRDRNGFRGGGGSSARGKQSGNTLPLLPYLSLFYT